MRASAECQRLLPHSGRLVTRRSHQPQRSPHSFTVTHQDTSEAATRVHFGFLSNAVIHLEDGVIPRSVISVHFFPSHPVSRNAFPFHLFFKQTLRYIKSCRSVFRFELIVFFYVSKRLWKFWLLSTAPAVP